MAGLARAGNEPAHRHVPLAGRRQTSSRTRGRHLHWPMPHWETICLVVASAMISLGCLVTVAAAVASMR
jgi:hypothetical protein